MTFSGGGPLAGFSVVVTRPKVDSDALADALGAAGARVVAFPVVEITDPEDGGAALAAAAASLDRYRWVAFTSANAVARLFAAAPDPGALAGARLAAVGAATAAALTARGLAAELVADHASAEGLADSFPAPTTPDATVLFPAASGARPTLPERLRAGGWTVDEVVAYRTVPAPPPSGAVAQDLAHADAVTFASPSAVEAYVACRTGSGRPLPVPPVVACIGPVTAEAARSAGFEVAVVAQSASAADLVDALVTVLTGGRGAVRARGSKVAPR